MNSILKFLALSFLMFMSGMAYAQDDTLLEKLYADFASKCITLDISYVIELPSSDIKGDGIVMFQGDAYHLSGNGIEVNCDGTDVWLMDPAAKEVYIEPVTDGPDAFMQNPALLFVGLNDNFFVSDIHEGGHMHEDGVKDVVFELSPKVSCGIDECSIQIRKDGDLYYGTFVMSDGVIVRVMVKSIKKSDRKDISSFRPTQSFDSSWMVTDLR